LGPYPEYDLFLFLILNINYFYSFIFILVVGTTVAISASSWFTVWLGLEINLLSILPILIGGNSFLSSDSAIKYFIIQAVTSIMIVRSASLNLKNTSFYSDNFIIKIIVIALCVKAAIAPFHI